MDMVGRCMTRQSLDVPIHYALESCASPGDSTIPEGHNEEGALAAPPVTEVVAIHVGIEPDPEP